MGRALIRIGATIAERGGAFFMSGVKSKYCVVWKNLLTDFEPFYMVAKVSSFGGTRLTID